MIVLINPPFWPGKPLIISGMQKLLWDYRAHKLRGQKLRWLLKTWWNTVHLIRFLSKSWTISLSARKHDFYAALHHHKVVIIRNQDDAWCTPDIQELLEPQIHLDLHTLPGQHDDCWTDPEPYVQVIQSELANYRKEQQA